MALRKIFESDAGPAPGLGLVPPTPIHFDFPNFQGSLSQLFTCIREKEISLFDIPLLPICEAYFRYLLDQPKIDLDEGAAALAALAFLLERKAWMLLPLPESSAVEEDDQVLAIAESSVHEYFDALQSLRRAHDQRALLFFRSENSGPNPYELPYQMANLTSASLAEALRQVLSRLEPKVMEHVTRVGRSLVEEMRRLLAKLSKSWTGFGDLLSESATREDAVYAFLSILELIRLGQAKARVLDSSVQFSLS